MYECSVPIDYLYTNMHLQNIRSLAAYVYKICIFLKVMIIRKHAVAVSGNQFRLKPQVGAILASVVSLKFIYT